MLDYNEIDKSIHQLCQIIAKANRSFVLKEADDGHTNLYFDPLTNRILGRWINLGKQSVILALDLYGFEFQWLNKSLHKLASISIEGKTSEEVELEIVDTLPEIGLENVGVNKISFIEPLHFEIPEYTFAKTSFTEFPESAVRMWSDYRKYANEVCFLVLGYLQAESEVRIWPHHFDTGIYADYNQHVGLGFGWAMADSLVDQPYFYFSAYEKGELGIYSESLPKLTYGEWHISSSWKGGVLSMDFIELLSKNKVKTFVREVANVYLRA